MECVKTDRRAVRRLLIAVGLVLSFVAGSSAGALQRNNDPLLDKAIENLVGAHALLAASEAGDVSPKNQRQFDRHVARAQKAVDNAIEAIAEAALVSNWIE